MELTEKQKNCKYCHYDADGRPLKYLKIMMTAAFFLQTMNYFTLEL